MNESGNVDSIDDDISLSFRWLSGTLSPAYALSPHASAVASGTLNNQNLFCSLLGTLSIISVTVVRKRVCNSKVQPVFVLSLSDGLLAGLWLTGGILWAVDLSTHSQNIACLFISAVTIILECVSMNLTLVYAFFALAHLKSSHLPSALFYPYQTPTVVSHPLKTAFIYSLAWFLPLLMVLVLLLSVVGTTDLINNSSNSCWCVPGFANVLPMTLAVHSDAHRYNRSMKSLVLGYACVVFLHYIIVYPLLLSTYCSTYHRIRSKRPCYKESRLSGYYGATERDYLRGQRDAKHRVILYLLTFTILGCFNFLLSFLMIVLNSIDIAPNPVQQSSNTQSAIISSTLFPILLLQSLTVPLQGFVNAIVYGWTRRDFIQVVGISSNLDSQSRQEGGLGSIREGGYRTDSELHSNSYS